MLDKYKYRVEISRTLPFCSWGVVKYRRTLWGVTKEVKKAVKEGFTFFRITK
jgi:hypothetical protein